jgi:3-hydroxyisobutyrate dehydrogenase-like beta-hydroxyacid dehydrogenase
LLTILPTRSHTTSLRAAVLGLGEAGAALAGDLARAGAQVRGYDPREVEVPPGVRAADSGPEAVAGADLVLSVNSAAVAVEVAESVASALAAGQVFADLNTAAPALKRAAAAAVSDSGALFTDVALMRPVPGNGLATPALASGPGAERFAQLLGPVGMPVTTVGAEPGAAAARKLARSVFMKGLAASLGEAMAAAERLGCAEPLREDFERTLAAADGALVARLLDGSRRHAARRVEEMAAAAAMLEELGVEPRIAAASEAWLRSLAEVPA